MIKIHNDGKGKDQSWEARLDFQEFRGDQSRNFDAIGYGATEEEAIAQLKDCVAEVVKTLSGWDYGNKTVVAWDGTPVEEYLARNRRRR
ncbi:MAG: hypothetical protein ACYTEQ_25970 [Planctomycetota bacterium]|jgi:hypothetical protein